MSKKNQLLLLLICLVLDRALKVIAINNLIENRWFSLFFNDRLFFSFFQSNHLILITQAILTLVILYIFTKTQASKNRLALGLVFVGAISNLFDRLYYNSVVDYFNLPSGLIFNLSDVYITLGIILFLVFEALPRKELTNLND